MPNCKSDLRAKYRSLRGQMTDALVENQSVCIVNHLLKMSIWQHEWFHIFLPIQKNKEVCTNLLLPVLFGKKKRIAVSKCNTKKQTLTHFELTEHTLLKKNTWGIPEPIETETPLENQNFDVVIVPLLAYDKKGNRVGYGKGFYDCFLKNTTAVKIGVSFFPPTEQEILPYKNDVRLDYCVTPDAVWKF